MSENVTPRASSETIDTDLMMSLKFAYVKNWSFVTPKTAMSARIANNVPY